MARFRDTLATITQQEDVNFLLTNRIPRRLATRFMGWFSHIEQPLIRDLSIAIWRLFADVDLSDAREHRFRSLHHCFTRRLRDGTRPLDADPAVLVSPCDAIIGACGRAHEDELLQIKGRPYTLADLLGGAEHAGRYRNGAYVTLRLTSSMYHRFHAPHDCRVKQVRYIAGDTWNVNPVALKRVERLFCRNERAPLVIQLAEGAHEITLIPVAAILVAGIRLSFVHPPLDPRTIGQLLSCDFALRKGEEMGWFEHGSTIIVLAPPGFGLCRLVQQGNTIRAGESLMRMPP